MSPLSLYEPRNPATPEYMSTAARSQMLEMSPVGVPSTPPTHA